MAKFKKKKSEPTPEPDYSKKESPGKEDIPETENTEIESPPQTPSDGEEPSVSESVKNEKDRKLNRLFWLRVCLAIIAGTAATFIFEDLEGEERRWASIVFMILIFAGTIVVAKTMRMQLPPSDRKKIVTQGIGSYIFLYLFIWIVTYTLVNSRTISSGVNL